MQEGGVHTRGFPGMRPPARRPTRAGRRGPVSVPMPWLSVVIGFLLAASAQGADDLRLLRALKQRGLPATVRRFGAWAVARAEREDAGDRADLARAAVQHLLDRAPERTAPRERVAVLRRALRLAERCGLGRAARDTKDVDLLLILAVLHRREGMALSSLAETAEESAPEHRAEARAALTQALRLYGEAARLAEEAAARFDEDVPEGALARPVYRRALADQSRAAYGTAWTRLHLAQCSDAGPARTELLAQALETFRDFTEEFRDNPIVLDCYLGRVICLAELGKTEELLRLRAAIPAAGAAFSLHKRILGVLLDVYRKNKDYYRLEALCEDYFRHRPSDVPWDAADLAALGQWLDTLALIVPSERGAARVRLLIRADEAARRLYDHGPPWSDRVAKVFQDTPALAALPFGGVVRVTRFLARGRREEALRLSREGVRRAREARPPDPDLVARYVALEGVCLRKSGRDLDAAEAFIRLANDAPEQRSRLAAVSQAIAALTASLRRSAQPAEKSRLIAAADGLKRAAPGDPRLHHLEWLLGKWLIEQGDLDAARNRLARIPEKSDVGPHARYLLAYCSLKEAEALPAPKAGERLLGAVRTLTALARNPTDDRLRKPVALALVVAAEQLAAAEPTRGLTVLREHGAFLRDVPEAAALAGALEIELLARSGRMAQALARVDTLLQGKMEKEAVEAMARLFRPLTAAIQEARRQGDRADLAVRLGQLKEVSRRLAACYEERNDLAKARAVKRRVAAICLETGDYAEALRLYRPLAPTPEATNATDVLRGTGLALLHTGNAADALPYWRRLAAGTERGTPPWFEARYYTLLCLTRMGERDRARRALEQFVVLYPDLGGPVWRPRFAALKERLAGRAP